MKKQNVTISEAGAIPVNVAATPQLPLGTKFTITGVKLLPNGRFITNCKPGEETVLINSNQPSIYKLHP